MEGSEKNLGVSILSIFQNQINKETDAFQKIQTLKTLLKNQEKEKTITQIPEPKITNPTNNHTVENLVENQQDQKNDLEKKKKETETDIKDLVNEKPNEKTKKNENETDKKNEKEIEKDKEKEEQEKEKEKENEKEKESWLSFLRNPEIIQFELQKIDEEEDFSRLRVETHKGKQMYECLKSIYDTCNNSGNQFRVVTWMPDYFVISCQRLEEGHYRELQLNRLFFRTYYVKEPGYHALVDFKDFLKEFNTISINKSIRMSITKQNLIGIKTFVQKNEKSKSFAQIKVYKPDVDNDLKTIPVNDHAFYNYEFVLKVQIEDLKKIFFSLDKKPYVQITFDGPKLQLNFQGSDNSKILSISIPRKNILKNPFSPLYKTDLSDKNDSININKNDSSDLFELKNDKNDKNDKKLPKFEHRVMFVKQNSVLSRHNLKNFKLNDGKKDVKNDEKTDSDDNKTEKSQHKNENEHKNDNDKSENDEKTDSDDNKKPENENKHENKNDKKKENEKESEEELERVSTSSKKKVSPKKKKENDYKETRDFLAEKTGLEHFFYQGIFNPKLIYDCLCKKISKCVDIYIHPKTPMCLRFMIQYPHSFIHDFIKEIVPVSSLPNAALLVQKVSDKMLSLNPILTTQNTQESLVKLATEQLDILPNISLTKPVKNLKRKIKSVKPKADKKIKKPKIEQST